LKIVMGTVKSLRISVPWQQLSSKPVRVTLDGIYALAILKDTKSSTAAHSQPAVDVVARRQLREKRRKLRWAQLHEEPDEGGDSGQHEESIWTRMLGKVVDNLVVEVRNAHVRIEDPSHWSDRSFAFGASLRRFSATTCNAQGVGMFVDRTAAGAQGTDLHRSVQLVDLAVYWDPDAALLSTGNLQDARIDMHELEFEASDPAHDYVLAPCSPAVMVTKSEKPSLLLPRWAFDVNLGGIHVRVTRAQFQDVLGLHLAFERHLIQLRPNPRPAVRPGRNPRAWWKYAIQRIVDEGRRRKQANGPG
jgi:vacuolar protein sorting-associated protein 13A/C